MPPNQDAPVSPMEHRDSSASLYDPPPLKGQGHHSHVVSRENSETSVFASGALPRPPIGQNRQQQPTPKATSVMQPSNRQGSGNKFSVLGSGAGPSDWAHFDTASADSIDDTELYARKESIRRHEQEIEIMELDSTPIPALAVQSATSITDVPKPAGLLQSALPATVGGEVPKGTESPLSKGQPSAKDDEQDGARNRLSSQPLDIAPALDPWYKNSLMRYIAMLYNEAGAAHVEEKHRIFTNFMIEEARLRGINPSLVSASASGYTPVLEYLQSAVAQKPKDSTLEKAEKKEQKESKGAKVDGSVVVQPVPEEQEDLQYSPGGRPIVARPTKSANASRSPSRGPKPASQVTKPTAQPERIPSPHPAADGDRRPSSGGKPAQPVYVPFRAGANANTGSKPPTPTSGANQIAPNAGAQPVYKSVYRPYTPASATFQAAAPVTAAAASTGTSKAVVPTSSTQPPKAFQTSAQATPLSAEKTPEEYKAKEQPEANRPSTPPTATPPPLVQSPEPVKRPSPVHPSSLEKLKSLLPNQDPNRKSSTILNPRLENLKTSLLLYPSDYTFVTTAFDKWKTKAASHRASAEAEARQRGVESQQRIDQLFNNKEIAYSDIALLEDSHKQQEAEIKSQMNEVEYESYLTDVFDPLYKRLQEEIGVVTGLLRDAETMAKEDGVAGRDMLMLSSNAADRDDDDTASADEVDLAEVLRLVVELHYKLEERQEQLSECIVKRDRRRRAIDEVSVAGADKLNQVEFRQRLDLVEKNAAVAKSEDCKERLQPLWQLVRSSTLRGSRENKALLEEITRESEAAGEQLADPKNQSLKNFIKSALKALAASSTSLANSFYAIDTALNLAEFNSAVARATFDNAARHVITRLADERGAEDARLKEEHEARLGEIQTALKAAEESIEKAFRGREGQAEHEKRQKAALEEAKRRNADVRSALAVQTPIEPMGRGRFL